MIACSAWSSAARSAFDSGPWPSTPTTERSTLLHRVADLLQRDIEAFAQSIALEQSVEVPMEVVRDAFVREQLADAESEKKRLATKIDGARDRLEGLLQRIPE